MVLRICEALQGDAEREFKYDNWAPEDVAYVTWNDLQ